MKWDNILWENQLINTRIDAQRLYVDKLNVSKMDDISSNKYKGESKKSAKNMIILDDTNLFFFHIGDEEM